MVDEINNDVIIAPATAIGGGSIASIRVSGEKSIELVNQNFTGKDLSKLPGYSGCHGTIIAPDNKAIDEVVVFVFRKPRSYTGENMVEISCHGNIFGVEKILSTLLSAGAKMAKPGEFTQRAFENSKIDMTKAEAIADIIAAETELAYENAFLQLSGILKKDIDFLVLKLKEISAFLALELDFSEEDISFVKHEEINEQIDAVINRLDFLESSFNAARIMKEGIRLAIVGKPNTGKSSLLNAFLKQERAIVSHIPGTTRDTVEESVHFGKLLVRIIDTAGIRQTGDHVEKMGVARSRKAIANADFVLFVFDQSQPLNDEDFEIIQNDIKMTVPDKTLIIANKSDKTPYKDTVNRLKKLKPDLYIISAKTGANVNEVQYLVEKRILEKMNLHREDVIISNLRHQEAIHEAIKHLKTGKDSLSQNMGNEIAAEDLRNAIANLESIIGKITSEDVLNTIFSQFCIGK